LGLILSILVSDLGWLLKIKPIKLLFVIFLSALIGLPAHALYHLASARLMGYDGVISWYPVPTVLVEEPMTKLAAIGMKLAPLIDFTLLISLILFFFPSILSPFLTVFLVGNLAGSGIDLVQSYYILKLADSDCLIQFTPEGFEIWEQ